MTGTQPELDQALNMLLHPLRTPADACAHVAEWYKLRSQRAQRASDYDQYIDLMRIYNRMALLRTIQP